MAIWCSLFPFFFHCESLALFCSSESSLLVQMEDVAVRPWLQWKATDGGSIQKNKFIKKNYCEFQFNFKSRTKHSMDLDFIFKFLPREILVNMTYSIHAALTKQYYKRWSLLFKELLKMCHKKKMMIVELFIVTEFFHYKNNKSKSQTF